MNRKRSLFLFALLAASGAAAQVVPAPADGAAAYDTVRAGRFDSGRMFTLDEPPLGYFREQYGFEPDAAWFERARLGALRFATYCSASFVSEDGLILTNHHCARESVTQVSGERGADFNEVGFVAASMADEAPVEGLFVEQLIAIVDVSDEVEASASGAADPAERQQLIQGAIEAVQDREGAARGEGFRVQVVSLYAGGQYKAYAYRRYDDVRLVFAPETQLGYFGGDPDNFTYPRYSLDFSLFRAYGEDGQPLETPDHFRFEPQGTQEGDLVFVIGNPGSTTRLQTVSQLEFRRDVVEPAFLDVLGEGERIYGDYVAANPDAEGVPELRDLYFSLGNSRKAYTGRVEGLRDPYLLARRRAAERDFRTALEGRENVRTAYGDVLDRIATNRQNARADARLYEAFAGFSPASPLTATVMGRAFLVAQLLAAPADGQEALRESILALEDQPTSVQEALVAARLARLQRALGASDPVVVGALQRRTPEDVARALVAGSALASRERAEAALANPAALASDPAVEVAQALLPAFGQFQQATAAATAEIGEQAARLARARFELYGTETPPDATFTLRISDGVVRGYPYNGTVAPAYTTFYGMYDRHASFGPTAESGAWALPQRWLDARDDLDLSTPYNLVSTNDIIGGNSGSPLLNRDLEVVGIVFDGNIESLPGNFIFDDARNRTVSLDARAMLEVLEDVYDLDRVATELRNGGM